MRYLILLVFLQLLTCKIFSSFDLNIDFLILFSRQTNIIHEKIRTTIEAIRVAANHLLKEPSREQLKSDHSKLTFEETNTLLDGLQMLFNKSDYDEQIPMLTIAPSSRGRTKIQSFFSCTRYQAQKSIALRNSFNILTIPDDLRGNVPIDPQVIKQGIDFMKTTLLVVNHLIKKT